MFPRLYTDESCPIDGYQGYTFRVLLNPTGQEKDDWALGHTGVRDCAACTGLNPSLPPFDPTIEREMPGRAYCPSCQAARDRLGRAAVAVYGTSHVDGFDFATVESSLATFGMDDLPDELLLWLYMLPGALWQTRAEDIKKKLPRPSTIGSSTPDSA